MGLYFCHSWEEKGIELGSPHNLASKDDGLPVFTALGPIELNIMQVEEIVMEGESLRKGYEDHFSCLPASLAATLSLPSSKFCPDIGCLLYT